MDKNNEEEDYKMKMYEAQAMVIEKEEEIEKNREEMDKMRREMDELRRRLGEQRRNDSLEGDLSIRVSSIEDQVKNAVAVLTRNIVSLQKNDQRNRQAVGEVRDELGELEAKMETIRNDMKEMKIETLKNEMNSLKISVSARLSSIEDQVTNAVAIITQNIVSLQKNVKELSKRREDKIDDISQKIDGMEGETSQSKSKVYPPQILVLGGKDKKNKSSDIFLLDYSGKIWKNVSIKLPQKIWGHGTVILEDELYIIGGGFSRTVYRLNKKMEWEKLADMHEERNWITNNCISHNGCIWVIGGGIRFTPLNTIEKYDPATDRWERKPAMKRGRYFAAAAVINDRIYVCGGFRWGMDSVEVFDISSEVWTDFCTLPQPRWKMSIIVDGANIVLIGGNNEKTVWKMDVEGGNKEWIQLPPLNEGRKESSAAMIEGCILVFGGNINDEPSCSVAIFSGQKWESFPPLPQPRRRHTSVVLPPAMIDAFRPFVLEK